MQNKIFKICITIALIITLTGLNLIFLGNQVILAFTNENFEISAYFEKEEAIIKDGTNLVLDINIQELGVFENGIIKIENANFKIDKEKVVNRNIKEINDETNEIKLNEIASGNITIILPVKFEKEKATSAEYFNKTNIIKVNGQYRKTDTNIREITGEISAKLAWTENTEVTLMQEIEKYKDLGETGILLQQKIVVNVSENSLPIENQTIKIAIPQLEEQMPTDIVVLEQGKKLEQTQYEINQDTKIIKILKKQGSSINWGTGTEEYKIIYTYPQDIEYRTQDINLETTATIKLYTKEQTVKTDNKQLQISEIGKITTLNGEVTGEIYKGYMYANVNDQINYEEKLNIEFSKANYIQNGLTLTQNTQFVDTNNQKQSTNGSVTYKTISINKNNMLDILGQEGYIQIQNQDNRIITTFNKEIVEDEKGNIIYTFEDEVNTIQFVTSTPQAEGKLDINIKKSISGQTGYDKETLKTFVALEGTSKMVNDKEEVLETKNIELKDTITEATLEISNSNLSSIEKNENVQMIVTLLSNNEKYDLYKNPYIEVKLPSEIEEIKVNSINKLYADEFNVVKAGLENNIIKIQLEGEQTNFQNNINKGIQIVINANLTISKTTPSKTTNIELIYKNENNGNIEQKKEESINIISKNGVILYNKIENYNQSGEKIETISEEVVEGKIDIGQEREAKVHTEIINNYKKAINQICIIGIISNQEDSANIELLSQSMVNKGNAEIYYSTENVDKDSETWTKEINDLSQAKQFKIVVNELNAGETIPINYSIKIPGNVTEGQEAYQKTQLYYEYEEEKIQTYTNIKLATEEKEINVDLTATIGEDILSEKDSVKEGEVIKYKIDIKNIQPQEIQNVQIKFKVPENTVYVLPYEGEIGYEYTGDMYYEEKQDTEIIETIEKMSVGEIISKEYEVRVKKGTENKEINGSIEIEHNQKTETLNLMKNKIEKGELRLSIKRVSDRDADVHEGSYVNYYTIIENITDEDQENVIVKPIIPEGVEIHELILKQYENGETSKYDQIVEYDEVNNEINIGTIEKNETMVIEIKIKVNNVEKNQKQFPMVVHAKSNAQNWYRSNIYNTELVYVDIGFEMTASTYEDIKENDEFYYQIKIRNNGDKEEEVILTEQIPEELKIVKIEVNGEECAENYFEEIEETIELQPGEEVSYTIYVIVKDIDLQEVESITNKAIVNVYGRNKEKEIKHNIKKDNTNTEPGEDDTYSISGKAWIDENKNGQIDEQEEILSGIQVMLIDLSTDTNENNIEDVYAQIKTNENGTYEFDKIAKGKYIVVFDYNDEQYELTEYKKEEVSEEYNSDVIPNKINILNKEKVYAVTETIEIKDKDIFNINLGLIHLEKFDLSLEKNVSKIIYQNDKNTKVYGYEDTTLAKIELDSKEINNTQLIIEYEIKIKNNGEIAGYANNILDELPSGLEFESQLNTQWYMSNNKLYNKSLTNEKIKPGEEKKLKLVLTKNMTEENIGVIRNIAKIEEFYSQTGKKENEDLQNNNYGQADIIVSIKTGSIYMYIGFSILLASILLGGIYLIKRKVID